MLDFSQRLKQLRRDRHLTQAQVAKRIGVTAAMVSSYETDIRLPSYEVMVRLADLFGVTVDYLLCRQDKRFLDISDLSEEEAALVCGMVELLKKKGYDISEQHSDCGMLIFDPAKQDTGAGGSGCGCAASVLAEYLQPKVENGEWKRILFVPTGPLKSKVSFQEGSSVPGIAQAVVIEREEDV